MMESVEGELKAVLESKASCDWLKSKSSPADTSSLPEPVSDSMNREGKQVRQTDGVC